MDQNREYDSWDSSGKDFSLAEQFFVICDNRQGAKASLIICRQYSAFSLLLEGSHLKGSPR